MYIYRMTPLLQHEPRMQNISKSYFGGGRKASNQRREEAVREITIGAVRWKSEAKSNPKEKIRQKARRGFVEGRQSSQKEARWLK